MIGLKENVIIGKLIPAGTGMKRYRTVKLDTDEKIAEEKLRKEAERLAMEEAAAESDDLELFEETVQEDSDVEVEAEEVVTVEE